MKEAYMLSKIYSSEEKEKNKYNLNIIWYGKDFGA
jgi:hypothetical protein